MGSQEDQGADPMKRRSPLVIIIRMSERKSRESIAAALAEAVHLIDTPMNNRF
jgi:hypothetical protein